MPGRYPGRTPVIQFSHLAHPGSGARETVPRDIVRAREWVPRMDARGWSAASDPKRREVTRATRATPGTPSLLARVGFTRATPRHPR